MHKNKKLIFILISVITLIIILPFLFFENNQLNNAVLIPPICKGPVGDGANLVATFVIPDI